MALQEPSWKVWLDHTSHLRLRLAVTTLVRDVFLAGGANTEMQLPLYRGLVAAAPRTADSAIPRNFAVCIYDLFLAVQTRAEAARLPLDNLGDPATLASRLEEELNANRAFASFVALVGAFARKRAV